MDKSTPSPSPSSVSVRGWGNVVSGDVDGGIALLLRNHIRIEGSCSGTPYDPAGTTGQ